MAGVALGDIHRRFAWQAWYLWAWAGSGDVLGPGGTLQGAAPFCVAGVALGLAMFNCYLVTLGGVSFQMKSACFLLGRPCIHCSTTFIQSIHSTIFLSRHSFPKDIQAFIQ